MKSNPLFSHCVIGFMLGMILLAAGTFTAHAALIGRWTFDEASSGTGTGTVLDSTIGAHNGAINGSAQYVPGVVGNGALSFDGVDDYVDFGLVPALDLTGGSYTIAFWVKYNVAHLGRIINMDDGNDCSGGYSVFASTSNVRVTHNTGSCNDTSSVYPALSIGAWHHVAVVYDSAIGKLNVYYEGVSQGLFAVSGLLTSDGNDPLLFGAINNSGPIIQFLNGSLDEVRIYNEALSAAQVAELATDYALTTTGNANDGFDPNVGQHVFATAVQADGRIIIGGNFDAVGGTPRNHIARLNADGTLDTGFNPDANAEVFTTAVQADGKILIGGVFNTVGGTTRNNFARLNPDGTLDIGFNPDANDVIDSLAVQADGKILVGGAFTTLAGQTRNRIARLNADGTLDTGFNPDANGDVFTTAVQADGKIVIGGLFNTVGGTARNFIARLNADGTLDTGFNPDADNGVYSLAVQADGKILVGGDFTTLGGQTRNRIARLNADGTLDTGFNPDANAVVFTTVVQANGKIVIGGTFITLGGQPRDRIGRLNADGTVDPSFNPGAVGGSVNSLAVQADGNILLGGSFTNLAGQPRNRMGRLYPDGALDATLNPGANNPVFTLAVQADGKILAGGPFTNLFGQSRRNIGRLSADGNLDATFNPGANNTIETLAVQADGKILAGGNFTMLGGQTRIRLGRLNSDATLDTNFNPVVNGAVVFCLAVQPDEKILVGGNFISLGGVARTNIGRLHPDGSLDLGFAPRANGPVHSLVLQPEGKILVGGGFTTLGGVARSRIGRLDAGGTLDPSFNPGADFNVNSLLLQADGNILVGGMFTMLAGQPRSRVGRLMADGTLDATFDPIADTNVNTLVLQANGKILIGGSFTTVGGLPRNRIARLNPNGSVDPSFDPGAQATVNSLAVQADGKILVGGSFTNLAGQARNRIGRLTSGSAALQTLFVNPVGTAVTWNRSGAGPEVGQVTFEQSGDGISYSLLGSGTRISGGWRLAGLALPFQQNFYIRARGRPASGQYSGSSGLIESVRQFYLQPLMPLAIDSQPVSQTINPDGTALLHVTASGNPPPLYQWRLNGVDIAGATNADFIIPNAQATNGGSFQVVVWNEQGVTNSAVVSLIVNTPAGTLTDNFGDSVLLVDPTLVISATNVGMTQEPGEPKHAGKMGGKSVWLRWVAPTNGIVTFRTTGSAFDTLLAAYTNMSVGTLTAVASDDDRGGFLTSQISFNVVPGQEYHIAVDGLSGAEGRIVLSWEFEATPDTLPVIAVQPENQTLGLSSNATFSVEAIGLGLGYQWFFDGTPILSADGPELVVSNVQPTNVGSFFVRVIRGARFSDSRTVSLQISLDGAENFATTDKFYDALNPPAGQPFAGGKPKPIPQAASLVVGYTGTQIFSTRGSGCEPGEPNHCNVRGGASQWFAYTPPSSGMLHLNTHGSTFDTVLGVYVVPGTTLATLTPVTCDNNSGTNGVSSRLSFQATSNAVYYVVCDGVNAVTGTVNLNYRLLVPIVLTNVVMTNSAVCRFLVTATPSYDFTIQRSSDLVNWTSVLMTNTASGTYQFSDTNALGTAHGFYRATQAP